MSYHEKSAWLTLIPILLVFVPYFIAVFKTPFATVFFLIIAVIALVVILTICRTGLAIATPKVLRTGDEPGMDEMERRFDRTSVNVAAYFLSTVVVLWCLNTLVGIPIQAFRGLAESERTITNIDLSQLTIPAVDAVNAVQLLFAGFVLANVIYYVSLIVCYRRVS